RIAALREEIGAIERTRDVQRAARTRSGLKTAAIIGYTNAGKSTLLNTLTNAGILAEDKLFATLDPTTRRLTLPSGTEMLLVDTVGFIDRLPTQLVKAFKSTLEELKYADILIHLTDASEEIDERERKHNVVTSLVQELGAADKPVAEVFNKCDLAVNDAPFPSGTVEISAKSGEGIGALLEKLDSLVADGKKRVTMFFGYGDTAKFHSLAKFATVVSQEYLDEGISVTADCDEKALGMFAEFIKDFVR
ncbi:MAG: 50S ribosome-binding GTPase, partial [Clostridia bacterium]|nr:50S ribosome-binding GTPase [Clostridia bacterium]